MTESVNGSHNFKKDPGVFSMTFKEQFNKNIFSLVNHLMIFPFVNLYYLSGNSFYNSLNMFFNDGGIFSLSLTENDKPFA